MLESLKYFLAIRNIQKKRGIVMASSLQWIVVLTTSLNIDENQKSQFVNELLAKQNPEMDKKNFAYISESDVKENPSSFFQDLLQTSTLITILSGDPAFLMGESNAEAYLKSEFPSLFDHDYQIIIESFEEDTELSGYIFYFAESQDKGSKSSKLRRSMRKSEKKKLPPIGRKGKARTFAFPSPDKEGKTTGELSEKKLPSFSKEKSESTLEETMERSISSNPLNPANNSPFEADVNSDDNEWNSLLGDVEEAVQPQEQFPSNNSKMYLGSQEDDELADSSNTSPSPPIYFDRNNIQSDDNLSTMPMESQAPHIYTRPEAEEHSSDSQENETNQTIGYEEVGENPYGETGYPSPSENNQGMDYLPPNYNEANDENSNPQYYQENSDGQGMHNEQQGMYDGTYPEGQQGMYDEQGMYDGTYPEGQPGVYDGQGMYDGQQGMHDGAYPEQQGMYDGQQGIHDGTYPEQPGMYDGQQGMHDGTYPEQPGMYDGQQGMHDGTYPEQPGMYDGQQGMHDGTYPEQPGMYDGQQGMHDGTYPEQQGMYDGQHGMHDGTYPEQQGMYDGQQGMHDGTYPEQQGMYDGQQGMHDGTYPEQQGIHDGTYPEQDIHDATYQQGMHDGTYPEDATYPEGQQGAYDNTYPEGQAEEGDHNNFFGQNQTGGEDDWANFLEDLNKEVDIVGPNDNNIPSNQESKLSNARREDESGSKVFAGRGLFLTEEQIAIEKAMQNQEKKKSESFLNSSTLPSSNPPSEIFSPPPPATTSFVSELPLTSTTSSVMPSSPTIEESDVSFEEEEVGYSEDYVEDVEPSSTIASTQTEIHDFDDPLESKSFQKSAYTPPPGIAPVATEETLELEEDALTESSIEKKVKKSLLHRLFRICMSLIILGAILFGSDRALEKYSPKYRKFIYEQGEEVYKVVKKYSLKYWIAIKTFIGEDETTEILENLEILARILDLEIKENPNKLEWCIDKLERFNTLNSSTPGISSETKVIIRAAVDKKIELIAQEVRNYLESTVTGLLEEKNFIQAEELLEQPEYQNSPYLKNNIEKLQALIVQKEKETIKELVEYSLTRAERGQFAEAVTLLDLHKNSQRTNMAQSLTKAKELILNGFVKKCLESNPAPYKESIQKLVSFLGERVDHRTLKTESYIIKLIHNQVLAFCAQHSYSAALQFLEPYEKIQAHTVRVYVNRFKDDVRKEKAIWFNLCRGILKKAQKSRDQGTEYTFHFYLNEKRANVTGKVTARQEEILKTGRFGVQGNRARFLSIKDLQDRTLMETIRLGLKTQKNINTIYNELALFLFSQGRLTQAKSLFQRINKLSYFEDKMSYR